MDRGRLRLPVVIIATVAVAEAAVLLLRPREGVIEPASVRAGSYFSPQEIERARDYRRPQLALYGGSLVIQGAVLTWLVLRPPPRLRGPFRRPLVTAALAGATLSLALEAATLPIGAVSRQRAIDVGLATQSWDDWAGDVAKASGIGAAMAGAGAALAIALMRRFGPRWWAPGSALLVALAAGMVYVGPVVLDPVFNKFTPLPEGRTRSDVLELARRAGVQVGEVYSVDASRRTTAANAYVAGLGSTKRVVLYDTLLENFTPEEARLVIAHELAHVHHRDVPKGLLYLAIVAPFGLLAVARLTQRLAPEREPGPATLPALVLSLGLVAIPVTTISNQLSRRVEARADSFSLQLTRAPEPFISFERRITVRNVSDPDPPDVLHWLLGTHPKTVDRIGIAKAFEAGAR